MKKLLLFLLILLSPRLLSAEIITLKDNTTISGTIISQTKDMVTVMTDKGQIEIKKEEIATIDYGASLPENTSQGKDDLASLLKNPEYISFKKDFTHAVILLSTGLGCTVTGLSLATAGGIVTNTPLLVTGIVVSIPSLVVMIVSFIKFGMARKHKKILESVYSIPIKPFISSQPGKSVSLGVTFSLSSPYR